AAALRPATGAFAEQPRANSDKRFHAKLFRDRDDLAQLLELLDDHDNFFAELRADQRHFDEAGILVAVANDEAAHLALHGEAGEQLRFAADFEAEIERLAGIKNFLHHFAELVDLDGKHAAVFALEVKF